MAVRYFIDFAKDYIKTTMPQVGVPVSAAGFLYDRYSKYLNNKKNNFQTQQPKQAEQQNQKYQLQLLKGYSQPTTNKELLLPKYNLTPKYELTPKQSETQSKISGATAAKSSPIQATAQATTYTAPQTTTVSTTQSTNQITNPENYLATLMKFLAQKEEALKSYQDKLNKELEPIEKEIVKTSQERDKLINEIENNPYLSQATIRGRTSRAYDLYNKTIQNLVDKYNLINGRILPEKEEIEQKYNTIGDLYTNYFELKQAEEQDAYDRQMQMLELADSSSGSSDGTFSSIGSAGYSPDVVSWAKLIESGKAKMTAVPKSLKTQVAQYLASKPVYEDKATRKKIRDAHTAISKAQEALKYISPLSTGVFGQVTHWIGGTPAKDLSQALKTIRAKLAFDTLQALRDASPTGGALGQVSERELDMLESSVANLDIANRPEVLRQNLQQVIKSYNAVIDNIVKQALIENPNLTDEQIKQMLGI